MHVLEVNPSTTSYSVPGPFLTRIVESVTQACREMGRGVHVGDGRKVSVGDTFVGLGVLVGLVTQAESRTTSMLSNSRFLIVHTFLYCDHPRDESCY
jgi:hypothetical protein